MSRKSQAAYDHAFEYLNKNVFKLSSVASFTTDYEVAMRNALRDMNPTAKMYACHFHFCQAGKRKASQIIGFVDMIRSDNRAASIYYRLLYLPLLPAIYIKDAFESLQNEAFTLNRSGFKKYFAYFEKQWIVKVN